MDIWGRNACRALVGVALLTLSACGSSGGHGHATSTPASTATGTPSPTATPTHSLILFSPENNDLNVYDLLDNNRKQVLISGNEDGTNPNLPSVNAQVCFNPDGSGQFILGDDPGQPNPPPGWAIFQLHGSRVGEFSVTQVSRLIPTYQGGPATGDNFGCGYLPDGRVLTVDIGEKISGPGTGQLIIWFPPLGLDYQNNHYCKIDIDISTAGGLYIDDQQRLYVASGRNDPGVYRYTGPFPTSDNTEGGCGAIDDTGAPMADVVNKELFIAGDENVPTPYDVRSSGHGTFYVSSVLNGVIGEYGADGAFIRRVLEPPAGEVLGATPFSTGSPLGLAVDSTGTLYYADLGLIIVPGNIGPGDFLGTVRRIRFENGNPLPPETIDNRLNFPDGLGILEH